MLDVPQAGNDPNRRPRCRLTAKPSFCLRIHLGGCQEHSYDLHSFFFEGLYIAIVDVEHSEYWSQLIKPVSGLRVCPLSNVAQTHKAPPVIIESLQCSGMST